LRNEDLNLQELALSRGGTEKYSLDRAAFFNAHHRKAKTQINRSLILAFTDPDSDSCLALNVMNGKEGPMSLHPSVSHLKNIDGLRKLMNSDQHLYTDEVVHRKWVSIFASGAISGCPKAGPKEKLDEILDVDYEAHARYEMYSRLAYQGFIHGYKPRDLAQRSKEYRQVRKLVRKDRLNNLPAAEANRLAEVMGADGDATKAQALGSGGLADTTDDEDDEF
jgi:hypothetical protein